MKSTTRYKIADELAGWGWLIIFYTILISAILGLAATIAGRALTNLGDGPGGAWGIPNLALIVPILFGLPALLVSLIDLFRRNWHQSGRVWAFIGPMLIGFGYLQIAHTADPCFNGLWTLGSRLEDIALCERFGSELNIHTRFHLLLHAAPTLPLVWGYRLALQKWHPLGHHLTRLPRLNFRKPTVPGVTREQV